MRLRSTSFLPIQAIRLFILWFVWLAMMLNLATVVSAQVRYVKTTGSNSNPTSATSWASATSDLQGAINSLTATGGQVWVAAGTYKPTTTTGPASRTICFAMRNQVAIYGGFVGNETSLTQRPPINLTTPSATTLSGDIGTPGDQSDNTYHVFYHPTGSNLNSTAVLDGVVITAGNSNETEYPRYGFGGGMYNAGSNPTLTNCSFQANSAYEGGGVYNRGSSPTLTNCRFIDNSTGSSGGGIYNTTYSYPVLTTCLFQSNSADEGGGMGNAGSSPTLTNCRFEANSADGSGGGMENWESSPTLTNCSFQNNVAASGGGMYNTDNSNPTLRYCSFRDHSVTFRGAAMENIDCSPILLNCSFQTNSAGSYGGGLFNLRSNPTLVNCSFQANTAPVYGGGLFNNASRPVLTNCSFQANSSASGGAILNAINSRSDLVNCVLFGNGGDNTLVNLGNLGSNSFIRVSYSLMDVPGLGYNYFDQGNVQWAYVSPFVSTTSTQLNSCAPAINAGTNSATALSGITTDLAGNARFYNGGTVDMGAYEYQGVPNSLSVTTPNINRATAGQFFSQSFSASGGTAPYSFSVATGSLPTGLSLSTTGVLSGTPTQAGYGAVAVLVRDAGGCLAVNTGYVLYVDAPILTLSSFEATSNPVCVGNPVTFTATMGNLTDSYSYTLTNGTNSITGSSSSAAFSQTITPAQSGGQNFTLVVSSNGQLVNATVSLTVNTPPTASISPSNATLTCATPTLSLTASGGNTYHWENNSTNAIRTVTTAGTYSVTVTTTNGCTATTSATVNSSMTLNAIATASSTTALAGNVVSLSASGGNTYQWLAPAGVSLSNPATTSLVSATLTTSGPKTFSVTVSQGSCSQTRTVSLTAIEAPDLTCILAARPSTVYGPASISLVVDVFELNNIASSNPITLRITKDANLTLNWLPDASSIAGRDVQNRLWSFRSDDSSYYVLTISQGLAGGEKVSVGLTGMMRSGATSGVVTVSGAVTGSGEVRLTNNIDAEKIYYFQQ